MAKIEPITPLPSSLEEAEMMLDRLWLDIESINEQLRDTSRIGPDGKKIDENEYLVWLRRARTALVVKRAQYRAVRTWIRQHVRKSGTSRHEAVSALGELYDAIIDFFDRNSIEPDSLLSAVLSRIEDVLEIYDPSVE